MSAIRRVARSGLASFVGVGRGIWLFPLDTMFRTVGLRYGWLRAFFMATPAPASSPARCCRSFPSTLPAAGHSRATRPASNNAGSAKASGARPAPPGPGGDRDVSSTRVPTGTEEESAGPGPDRLASGRIGSVPVAYRLSTTWVRPRRAYQSCTAWIRRLCLSGCLRSAQHVVVRGSRPSESELRARTSCAASVCRPASATACR